MELVYVNPNKLSESRQLALSWWSELEHFTQMVFIQAFQLQEVNSKTIETVYNKRNEYLKSLGDGK